MAVHLTSGPRTGAQCHRVESNHFPPGFNRLLIRMSYEGRGGTGLRVSPSTVHLSPDY